MKRVGLLMGGMGSEREISFKTGAAFERSLKSLGYPYEAIDVGPDLPDILKKKKIDVALLALHGQYGEDGTVQGILEYMRIPYSGSGVLASSLGMNKIVTKQILSYLGVPTPEFQVLHLRREEKAEFKLSLDLPVVVKPTREGSTVGITIVKKQSELSAAIELAARYDHLVLIEKYVPGMEVTVPVWFGKPLPTIEIISKTEFYDYESKYTPGQSEHIIPARLSKKAEELCRKYSIETFYAINARHYARVDLRVDGDKPFVLEINTLPGCTETSLFPESAAKAGITFDEFIKTLVENATLDYE